MIVYLWAFTVLNAVFLVRMHVLHLKQLKAFHDHVGHAKEP